MQVYGNRCLDISGSGTANGTKVQIWTCNGTGAQRFTFGTDGSLVVPASGKCVEAAGGGTANGTLAQLYTCNGSAAQRWSVR